MLGKDERDSPQEKTQEQQEENNTALFRGPRATCREMKRERMRSINKPHGDG